MQLKIRVSNISETNPLFCHYEISRIYRIRQIQSHDEKLICRLADFWENSLSSGKKPRGRSGTSSFTCLLRLIVHVNSVEQISRYRNNPLQNRAHNNRY